MLVQHLSHRSQVIRSPGADPRDEMTEPGDEMTDTRDEMIGGDEMTGKVGDNHGWQGMA